MERIFSCPGMQLRLARRWLPRVLVVTASVLFVVPATAGPWYIDPYVDIGIGYNDNPFLATEDEISTGVSPDGQPYGTFGGHLELATESPSLRSALILEALARRYQDDEFLDSEYLLAAIELDKTGQTTDFGLQMGVSEDATLESELTDTGRFEVDVNRRNLYIRPSVTYRFSELWATDLTLGYEKVEFDDNGSDLTDFEQYGAVFRISRVLTQRTLATLDLDYLYYEPLSTPGEGEVIEDQSYRILLGAEHQLTERSRITWSVGPDYRDTLFTDIGRISDEDISYRAGYTFEDNPNLTSLEIYSLEEGSADGSLVRAQGLSFQFARRISSLTLLGLGVILEKRNPVRGDIEERDYFEFNPRMEWAVTRNLSTILNLYYREQDLSATSELPAQNSDQFNALLELRYTWDRKYF